MMYHSVSVMEILIPKESSMALSVSVKSSCDSVAGANNSPLASKSGSPDQGLLEQWVSILSILTLAALNAVAISLTIPVRSGPESSNNIFFEFASLIDENAQAEMATDTLRAIFNKDKSHAKQMKWEAKRLNQKRKK